MILAMSIEAFTAAHVVLSLIGLASRIIVLGGCRGEPTRRVDDAVSRLALYLNIFVGVVQAFGEFRSCGDWRRRSRRRPLSSSS